MTVSSKPETTAAKPEPAADQRHSLAEDVHALLMGLSFVAVGVVLLKAAGLITGGVAGLALSLSYWSHWPVGPLFFALNLPFFALAAPRLGWKFISRSLIVMAALSFLTAWIQGWMGLTHINLAFAALFGGTLIGMGVLALARHHASVGGVGLLAIFLYENRGINVGKTQFTTDVLILLIGAFVVDLRHLAYSVLSAAALSLVIFAYHRPGRYTGS